MAIGWFRHQHPDIAESVELLVPTILDAYADLLQWVYILVGVYVLYLPFWLLSRTRWGAWLLGHSTLTVLYRRYHEPGTSLQEIMPGRDEARADSETGDEA